MNRVLKALLMIVLLVVLAVPVTGQEKDKKGRKRTPKESSVPAGILKKLKGLDLTEEQQTRVDEIIAGYEPKFKEISDELKPSPEQRKEMAEARKKAAAEGKKGKDLPELAAAAAKFRETQKEAREKQQELSKTLLKDLAEVLTPAQLEKFQGGKAKKETKKSSTKERKRRKSGK